MVLDEHLDQRKPIPVAGPEGYVYTDVVVVGAGISGIDAGYRLQTECPDKNYVIFEARNAIGGTWDLFRYPGIRSDSDMHTLGFSFYPWKDKKSIADGAAIRAYVEDTAKHFGIDQHIRVNHKVISANWDSRQALWYLLVEHQGKQHKYCCRFLYMCSGYYDYSEGHKPEWTDQDSYTGQIVHPQFWPEDLDYSNKKIVVIGSGATAVTLVPSLANKAEHVTMLQRSPTYIVSRPAEDKVALKLGKVLPSGLAAKVTRAKNVLLGMYFYGLARRHPQKVKEHLLNEIASSLGDQYDPKNFTPSYNPWDQRLCLIPDGDLFAAIQSKKADIVTDHIERFTPNGLLLKSGKELDADIIVTATGLKVALLGGMTLSVDEKPVLLGDKFNYKGMMFNDIPNFALSFGYVNASWTLKCDLIALYMCRLLKFMDRKKLDFCYPSLSQDVLDLDENHGLTSGYIERSRTILPKQSTQRPWRQHHNYAMDLLDIKYGAVNDKVMSFHRKQA